MIKLTKDSMAGGFIGRLDLRFCFVTLARRAMRMQFYSEMMVRINELRLRKY